MLELVCACSLLGVRFCRGYGRGVSRVTDACRQATGYYYWRDKLLLSKIGVENVGARVLASGITVVYLWTLL